MKKAGTTFEKYYQYFKRIEITKGVELLIKTYDQYYQYSERIKNMKKTGTTIEKYYQYF